LVTGALYFNTSINQMHVWSGSAWLSTDYVSNNVDINGGTIDGATIGGATPGLITGTTITGTSFVSSGDMTFGDNDKAIFGDSSDLQIYHDGSGSYVDDQGTGGLILRGTNLFLRSSTDENYIGCIADGTVTLYYDQNPKLATTNTGIDVTGTVTADGLTVDGNSRINGDFTIDTAPRGFTFASSLEMGTGGSLAVFGNANTALISNVYFSSDSTYKVINTGYSAATHQLFNGSHIFSTASAAGTAGSSIDVLTRMNIARTGDISFYEDTGTTAKFFWDASAERLGIGTSSPSNLLHLSSDTPIPLKLERTADADSYISYKNTTDEWTAGLDTSEGFVISNSSSISTNQRLVIDSSGNVGIGTSSPSQPLSVAGNAMLQANQGYMYLSDVGTGNSGIYVRGTGTANELRSHSTGIHTWEVTGSEKMRIDSSGRVGIGTTTPEERLHLSSAVAGTYIKLQDSTGTAFVGNSGNQLLFLTGVTERMRIDSSGNVGIGVTPSANTSGVLLQLAENGQIITNGDGYYSANAVYNSGWKYVISDYATQYAHESGSHKWFTASSGTAGNAISFSERMRIDSSGNLLVGTTTAITQSGTTTGSRFSSTGIAWHIADNAPSLFLGRTSTDGTIIDFRKDGTTVGSIGTLSDSMYFGNAKSSAYANLRYTNDQVHPCTSAGADNDNTINLGKTSSRFKNLYLSGGVYLGGTGAANYLDDYEEGTWTPNLVASSGSVTTWSAQLGWYTKVGNFVFAQAHLSLTTHTLSGNLTLTGLPFNTTSSSNYRGTASFGYMRGLDIGGSAGQLGIDIGPNSSTSAILYYRDNNTPTTISAASCEQIIALHICIHYRTD
jgi:hypothetical protein